MIIVSIKKIKTFRDLERRIKNKYGQYPDYIIVETKSAFNVYCKLLGTDTIKKKGSFYNYTFRGIPLILPWQIRI